VPPRVCRMSFKSVIGISHAVEVEAETVYEAPGLGWRDSRRMAGSKGSGPGSRLEITVREPSTMHSLTVQQLQRWVNSATTSPAEVLRRSKVKHLLGM
jgi:hypothetical protein